MRPMASTDWPSDAELRDAIRDEDAERVRGLLAAGADVSSTTGPDGKTPLMVAAKTQTPEIVGILLEAGADPSGMGGTVISATLGRRRAPPPVGLVATSTREFVAYSSISSINFLASSKLSKWYPSISALVPLVGLHSAPDPLFRPIPVRSSLRAPRPPRQFRPLRTYSPGGQTRRRRN